MYVCVLVGWREADGWLRDARCGEMYVRVVGRSPTWGERGWWAWMYRDVDVDAYYLPT